MFADKENFSWLYDYLSQKMHTTWWEASLRVKAAADKEFHRIDRASAKRAQSIKALNSWCDKWLGEGERKKVLATIRQRRKRAKDKAKGMSKKSSPITPEAHQILKQASFRQL